MKKYLVLDKDDKLIGYEHRLVNYIFKKELIEKIDIFKDCYDITNTSAIIQNSKMSTYDSYQPCYMHCLPKNYRFMCREAFERQVFINESSRLQEVYEKSGYKPKPFIKNHYASKSANQIIKALLNVCDERYLSLARKYPAYCRYKTYLLCCKYGERMAQIAETSPGIVHALSTASDREYDNKGMISTDEARVICNKIVNGVKASVILKDLKLGKTTNKVPKNCVGMVIATRSFMFEKSERDLLNFLPKNQPIARGFLKVLKVVERGVFGFDGGYDLQHFDSSNGWNAEWNESWRKLKWLMKNYVEVNQHVLAENDFRIIAGHTNSVVEKMCHIWDYIYRARADLHGQFNDNISLHRIMEEVLVWDQRFGQVGNNQVNVEFVDPWIPTKTVSIKKTEWEFLPITCSEDLREEGSKMNHCVGSYSKSVVEGNCYIYSLRKNDKRSVTIELVKSGPKNGYRISQARTKCNQKPCKDAYKAMEKWEKEWTI